MSCEHRWSQYKAGGIFGYRCDKCGVLGREVQSSPLKIAQRSCALCGKAATGKTRPPSNTFLCREHLLARAEKRIVRHRHGR